MAKKEHQISVKVEDRLLQIVDEERKGTERSRAAQIRYMVEKYLEIRDSISREAEKRNVG